MTWANATPPTCRGQTSPWVVGVYCGDDLVRLVFWASWVHQLWLLGCVAVMAF